LNLTGKWLNAKQCEVPNMKKEWEGKCQRFVHYRIFENKGKGRGAKRNKKARNRSHKGCTEVAQTPIKVSRNVKKGTF
jgi:hypothetical protein